MNSLNTTALGTAFIGNRIFFDENGNGLYEANEIGFAGAQVTLQGAGADGLFGTDDDVIRTQTTASGGFYGFGELAAGDYTVSIANLPAGFQLTHANVGNSDTLDSDFNPNTLTTGIISLTDGQFKTDIDAGVVQQDGPLVDPKNGFIGNRVFFDANSNGIFDSGEEGFAGARVTLRGAGADGLLDTADDIVRTQTTGAQGFYGFGDLAADQYTISVDNLPETFELTAKNVGSNGAIDSDVDPTSGTSDVIDLAVGQFRADVDAGVTNKSGDVDPKTAFIGNRVFLDADGNGLFDAGETGFAGAQVTLRGAGADAVFNTADDLVQTQQTGEQGFYGFRDLAAGEYKISIDSLAEGFQLTQANVGDNDAIDSDVGSNGVSDVILLESGEFKTDVDAGVVQQDGSVVDSNNAFIGNRVFLDANSNGLFDSNETGFAGAQVTLRGAGSDGLFNTEDDIVQSQTTAEQGFYGFGELAKGDYKISIDNLPEGFQLTFANAGNNDAIDSDIDPNTGTTATISLAAGQFLANVDAGVVSTPNNVDPQTGLIGNRVFLDGNGNGLFDADETGFAGAQVTLRGAGADGVFETEDDLIRTQTTGESGFYGFSNLAAGQYQVAVEPGQGYRLTQANVGTNDAIDSDVDPTSGLTDTIFLLAGQFRDNIDAGISLDDQSIVLGEQPMTQSATSSTPMSPISPVVFDQGLSMLG